MSTGSPASLELLVVGAYSLFVPDHSPVRSRRLSTAFQGFKDRRDASKIRSGHATSPWNLLLSAEGNANVLRAFSPPLPIEMKPQSRPHSPLFISPGSPYSTPLRPHHKSYGLASPLLSEKETTSEPLLPLNSPTSPTFAHRGTARPGRRNQIGRAHV